MLTHILREMGLEDRESKRTGWKYTCNAVEIIQHHLEEISFSTVALHNNIIVHLILNDPLRH